MAQPPLKLQNSVLLPHPNQFSDIGLADTETLQKFMQEALELLIINVSDRNIAALLDIIKESQPNPTYFCANKTQEILQALNREKSWDLILISEQLSRDNLAILEMVKNNTEDVPVIFLIEEGISDITLPAIKQNADDYIAKKNIERVLPVLNRELRYKKIREKYRESQKKSDILSDIVNSSTNEIFVFSAETYQCIYANQTAIKNNDYTAEEIQQLNPADIYKDYDLHSFQQILCPLFQQKRKSISACTRIQKKEGNALPVEIQLQIIQNDDRKLLVAMHKDISYHRHKIKKLKKQHQLAQEYRKQSERKSDFLANAAHDMRTSLNSIILSNKLLAEQVNQQTGKEFHTFTRAIHHSGNHLLQYINEFFDSSHGPMIHEEMDTTPIDIESFSQNLYQVFKPIAHENDLHFDYKIAELNETTINTNPTYLKRILKNILSNAFKYTEEGSVTLIVSSKPYTKLDARRAVAFKVKDTGIGIPKAEQNKIFKRHSKAIHSKEKKHNGSGLGLHICKELTHALGGELQIESEVGTGSTFTVFIPVKQKSASQTQKELTLKRQPTKKFNLKKKTEKQILIVDDSNVHNLATKEFLSYSFTKCVTAASKKEAYQLLKSEPIDGIVLDYVVNETTSIEIARDLKNQKEYADIPIIIYTGKKLSPLERKKLNKYTQAIIKKGTDSYNNLVDTLRSCLS